jgi:hypothetical protein
MKKIPKYNGKYLIDKDGNVFSNVKNRLLKPCLNKRGYLVVNVDGVVRPIHQLMAETFLDKNYKNKGLLVDHIDRNKTNNNLVNLRITDKSVNSINRDREFRLCIFQRRLNGNYYVIFRRNNKIFKGSFKTMENALKYRMSLEKEK